jgi:hypothetical protein
MKFSGLITLVILGLVCADVALGQRRGRRPGRRQQFRRGRQDAVPPADGYAGAEAPVDSYGAGAADEAIPTYADEGALDTYADASDAQDTYAAADPAADAAAAELAALESNIPGIPGEDYPIFAEVPETAFLCDGQVDGGYYADPEADCQAFHICTADGQGGLAKYSFLCPNGTVFNQNYFICDWWFNFDCTTAEELYSLNEDIAAERDANSPDGGAASAPQASYAAEGADDSYAGPGGDQANYDGEVREGRGFRRGRQGRRFRG